MRATALDVTDLRSVVELRPCWIARLFGARITHIELVRQSGSWLAANTRTDLIYLPHSGEIRRALDFRPVEKLPRATLRSAP